MNRPILVPKTSYTRLQWKNGLGYTDQIGIEPVGADLRAGNYDWRISTASITNASDFSVFPDHDRALVILNGGGLRLFHKDEEFEDSVELPPFEIYEFPGDIRSRCELIDGPVQDLSVFFRKGVTNAEVEVVRISEETAWNWTPRANWNYLVAIAGDFEVCTVGEETETLARGNAFTYAGPATDEELSFPVVPHGSGSVLVSIALWKLG